MSIIALPFGNTLLTAQLDKKHLLLLPSLPVARPEKTIIEESLAKPIRSLPLSNLARNKRKGIIVISDNSRPVPSSRFLPSLLKELEKGGLKEIALVIARGTHRRLTAKEIQGLVGSAVYNNFPCFSSCPEEEDHLYLGQTTFGNPIKVFRPILEADLKIVTGNLDFHRMLGFSGGIKGLFLAAASQESIAHNHSLSLQFTTTPGVLDNPIRQDMEEFVQKIGVDFLFNVVVNYQHQIIAAFAGHPLKAHQAGCEKLKKIFRVEVESPVDVIITSPGGSPKDLNLYQAVKTLQNALAIIKPGGTIILAAQCPEGCGHPLLAHWAEKAGVKGVKKLETNFILGAHKLKYIAEIVAKAKVKMITDLPKTLLQNLQIEKYASLQEAIDSTMQEIPQGTVLVMPYGGFLLPELKK